MPRPKISGLIPCHPLDSTCYSYRTEWRQEGDRLMTANAQTDLDSIAALDREDVEAAIRDLRRAQREWSGAGAQRAQLQIAARLARVADALAEHLIDRGDA